jgi:hypothetical protein
MRSTASSSSFRQAARYGASFKNLCRRDDANQITIMINTQTDHDLYQCLTKF